MNTSWLVWGVAAFGVATTFGSAWLVGRTRQQHDDRGERDAAER